MAGTIKKNAYFCDDPQADGYKFSKKLVVFGKRRKQKHELVSPDVFNVMRLDKKYNWIQIPQPHKQGRTYVPNITWWTGRYWREDPPRHPAFDREGVHFLMGLMLAFLYLASLYRIADYDDMIVLLKVFAMVGLTLVYPLIILGFFIYEAYEDKDIGDRMWRDVGGWVLGTGVTFAAFAGWLIVGWPGP